MCVFQHPIQVLPKPTGSVPSEAFAKRAFVSHPATGKHIAFDGAYLHGVPPELMLPHGSGPHKTPKGKKSRQKEAVRVTFLVNVWTTHRLTCAHLYPQEAAQALRVSAAAVFKAIAAKPDVISGSQITKVTGNEHRVCAACRLLSQTLCAVHAEGRIAQV